MSFDLANGGGLRNQAVHSRRLQYISSANTSISITVTPLGGSGTVYGPSACTSGTCAINFTATPGPNTIAFTLTDGSANVLSRFSTTTIVQPSTVNTLNFTANPVVSSIAVGLASSAVNAGTATDVLLTVTARDAANGIIVGPDNYVDANGNQLSVSLSVNNAQAGGKGTVTIKGAPRVVNASAGPIYARYDGKWLDRAVINATPSLPIAGSVTSATLATTPTAVEYTGTGTPSGIIAGPDGNMWFGDYNSNIVSKITMNGLVTPYSCGACANTWQLALGPDGNIWFTEATPASGLKISKMTPAGVPKRIVTLPGNGYDITSGANGRLWFGYFSGIGYVDPSGASQLFPIGGGDAPYALAMGPDGNLWVLMVTAAAIRKYNPSGVLLATYPVGRAVGGNSNGLVLGPDGNMWLAARDSDSIMKITPSGVVTPYQLPTGRLPGDVTVGPDGYIWFAESGIASIGRISTAGVFQEYSTNGITGVVYFVQAGPDGNMWFTEFSSNKVGKFIL